ncbi:membrane bound O-acyl transferase family-domain-containing protein [Aspergillus tetrazonus]
MADYVIQNLTSNLQAMQYAYSYREEMPVWATKLLTPIFMAVAVLTTLPPPGPLRVIVGLTAFTSLWLHVLTHWVSGPAFFMDAIFMISITVRWLLMFMAGTPEIDYHQTTQSGTTITYSGTKDSSALRQMLTKVRWSVELWSCWRGQGWNFVDQHLPRGAEGTQSRWEFLVSNAGRVLLNQYISDLVRKYAFCALWPSQVDAHVDFNHLPLLNRHGLVALQLIRDSLMLDSEYRKASILFVGLDLSTPDRWPNLFGNIRDLYTVRNFWGRVWHQIFRQIFTRCGDIVANALNAQKGTLLYKYSRLYVGFLVSGVQHYACALLIPSAEYGWGMFWQMPAYAAVITVEDILKYYGREAGIQDGNFVRFLGYLWTAYWMTLIYALPVGFVSDIGGFTGIDKQYKHAV